MASRRPPEVPDVQLRFVERDGTTPEELEQEIKELLAKRDAIFREMGYLPPDEDYEYWHKPSEDDGRSKKQSEH